MQNNTIPYSIQKKTPLTTRFNLHQVDPSWHACLTYALQALPADYADTLNHTPDWLPGADKLFNAFSLPVQEVNYVLLGESPYPRQASANGYAFWDAAVTDLWSVTGLSKAVNRATSLRNILKMLLVAEGLLDPQQTGQPDIAQVDKSRLIQTNDALFKNFLQHGFLLLNATLVFRPDSVRQDARAFRPFLVEVLKFLAEQRPDIVFILLGNLANDIDPLITSPHIQKLYAEHPYNISFIHNQNVIQFFKPLHLLIKN